MEQLFQAQAVALQLTVLLEQMVQRELMEQMVQLGLRAQQDRAIGQPEPREGTEQMVQVVVVAKEPAAAQAILVVFFVAFPEPAVVVAAAAAAVRQGLSEPVAMAGVRHIAPLW